MRTFRPFFILFGIAILVSMALPAQAQTVPNPIGLRPDAPEYAKHGSFWVGMKQIDAQTVFHPTTVQLWYPALNPSGVETSVSHKTDAGNIMMGAVQDAAPDTSAAPYPLVILVHGLTDQRLFATYLAEHLASYGFVVMSITYADHGGSPSADYALALYTRPKDVSWQIDYAGQLTGTGGTLPGMIDTKHIAVVGHSQGGLTALQAGGAQIDLSGPTSFCAQNLALTGAKELGDFNWHRDICAHAPQIAALAGLKAAPEGLWPSWGDPRVDAIVPLAPSPLFDPDSAKAVTVPTLEMVGSADHFVDSALPIYRPFTYGNLGSALKSLVVFDGADHLIFRNDCNTNQDAIPGGYFWSCSDTVWDMARAHDLINHFTTAFLLDVLKGDKEAHKPLLPDAVDFHGIEYQTTMK